MAGTEVKVPDIGDFKEVEVIEVLVKPGDEIAKEQSLITLESDKATMEIPSPTAGKVGELRGKVGDKGSKGSPILLLQSGKPETPEAPRAAPPAPSTGADLECDVLVLGAGPGGYSAAFRAADLGRKTGLAERYPSNWELSGARAASVVRILIAGGVPPERLSAISLADTQPVAPNDTPEGRAANRRIEIRLVPVQGAAPSAAPASPPAE